MVLRFSMLAVAFLLACTGVERDNPYDEKGVSGYWDSTDVKGEVEYKFTDSRDKKVYKAIEFSIGRVFLVEFEDGIWSASDEIKDDSVYYRISWMAENLNFNAPGSVCYNKDESNCTTYGRLYDFETAKTACPSGWRLPTSNEKYLDEKYLGSYYVREALGYEDCYKNEPYQDSNGQTYYRCFQRWLGLGGFGSDDGFSDIDTVGYWWTSTEGGNGYAYSLHGAMTVPNSHGSTHGELKKNMDDKNYFLSVRCIQDLE